MSGFLIGALLVALLAITLVVWPFLRRPASADFSRLQLNTAIYRDQFTELERDRNEGSLSLADYEQARAELQRRMLEDTAGESTAAKKGEQTAPPPASRVLPIVLGAFLLIGGALGYMALGNPMAINPPVRDGHNFGDAEIERMVADMAAKLEKEPENYSGWAMLARSYKVMNRYPDAVRAYARTGPMLDTSAELLVDYADAQAAVDNGFSKKVLALIDKALKLDPTNLQGLWLRGTAAFEVKQYDKAITDWNVLLKGLPPESEEARVIQANIAEARDLQGKAGKTGKVGADKTASTTPATAQVTITGRVEVAGNLAGKVPAGATLMVIARPADGSRMPVGVFIAKGGLPADFTLDDSLAMSPDNLLSKHKELLVEARLSQSGQAMPQAGDLFSPAQTVKLGANNVRLKIDQVR
ncbi:MAG: c-type cytochrome biogenesis protein CcmI [Rhodocyclaceae bacterium]|nr:c-type cytochrome biogenesis protein CcmI [Rhodocyclaceae bacterium]MDZ4214581.1 c-type cytochrome biogenesis protein CcmI [Rhodocyclaceae bacterium]